MQKADRDLFDALFSSAAKEPRSVTATLVIDGGKAGKFEIGFVVNQKVMTRLTDLVRDIESDYSVS